VYGKIFESMWEGSMAGVGSHRIAVWVYCISKANYKTHIVNLNPKVVATAVGDPVETVQDAIDWLCRPDPNSHSKECEGARIVKREGFSYFVVNHEHYRKLGINETKRAMWRKAQQRHRGTDIASDDEKKINTEVRFRNLSDGVYESNSEPLWEKLVENGIDLKYAAWIQFKNQFPDTEVDQAAIVDDAISFHATGDKSIAHAWPFLVKQAKNPKYSLKKDHTGSGLITQERLEKEVY